MRRASWMSFTWIVTRFAWIAHKLLQQREEEGARGVFWGRRQGDEVM